MSLSSEDRLSKKPSLFLQFVADRADSSLGASDVDLDDIGLDYGSLEDYEKHLHVIVDRFKSLGEVTSALKRLKVEPCGLIFGIDYTLSNKVSGMNTFHGLSLHDTTSKKTNPYQEVICILGETLEPLDDDGIIPAYGFGDRIVKDKGIFPLKANGDCDGFMEVLEVYNVVTPKIQLGGPTNFAPLIDEAVRIVKEKKQYHILVIVADGQVTNEEDTVRAIIEASEYPLSIVVIGVGDGPWDVMNDFDDKLPERRFDNFQFVDFHKVKSEARNPQPAVALAALMEIPDQFQYIRDNGLVERL
ncbi:copine family protein 1-like isoform X2 [Dreissena polymorpha]|uniref:copine family protein 1-like isoform X2 n=1 Tax=Dreissena polymorpha TaxID=45954 RepID=UPI002264AD4E|nr:copine family protein 1-like isoform X2 [Dreissena polymorpha]